jgi:AraC-like DNA-binding protein
VFLRSLLFDFAANGGQRLHERAHREDRRRSCAFSPPALLDECWKTRDVDPRQLLSAWAGRFFSALSATHPPTLADRAARLLRTEYYVAWTASALSARLGASRSALRNSFAREFRVTMHDYLRVTRLVRALEQFATVGKVDTIALKVGYRGRATFYQALNEFTRLTPTAFRQLTPPESYAIVESLRSRLARRT